MSGTNRNVIVAVLIVALLTAGATRQWADHLRASGIGAVTGARAGSSLTAMNSFALALLLGGLRGPLVMFLWTTSESQKSENNLEDFDTKVEWIRLLQPEFDTVHIFQIWNKAYNISVKMTSKANKYTTILDALEYAHRVDAERPNNINILSAIAGIYFDKLNGASEKAYYRKQIRTQTKAHAERERRRDDPGWRPLEHRAMLDEDGNILPPMLEPGPMRLGDANNPMEYYDGSELQFLKQYQPFPYGIPAVALGYNYYKRAQMLQDYGGQRHTQLSELVIDTRPALTLKSWAENEMQDGRIAELAAFGQPVKPETERPEIETIAGSISPTTQPVVDPKLAEQALYDYARARQLAADSRKDYASRASKYTADYANYESQSHDLEGLEAMAGADAAWLRAALTKDAGERQQDLAAARDGYRKTLAANQKILLRYYLPPPAEQLVLPPGVTRQNLMDKLPTDPDAVGPLVQRMLQYMHQTGQGLEQQESIDEYLRYMNRAEARLRAMQGTTPASAPVPTAPTAPAPATAK